MGHQGGERLGLSFPHIHHQLERRLALLAGEQGLVVPHLASGGIDEDLPGRTGGYLPLPQQVEGGV
ncbi:hypothetical protein D3C72_919630 [compost metagenome]